MTSSQQGRLLALEFAGFVLVFRAFGWWGVVCYVAGAVLLGVAVEMSVRR